MKNALPAPLPPTHKVLRKVLYLYGLAEPHLVRKDAVDPLIVQAAQPVHPLPLVGLQLALQLALGPLTGT